MRVVEPFLYNIGLALVILYLLMGFDDFIWDIFTLLLRTSYKNQRLDLKQLNSVPPKLLALTVAAWHEDNVLGDVIDNIIASTDYPRSMYHIFLGVYPNDDATIAVAQALAERYPNVHVVINELPGPTSKAQNLNYVIRQINQFEQQHGWQFASLTIHDSEDVVHPYELLATNYLLESHEALQFPVFPLMRMPRFSNFFKTITTGTYADEFAENHFTTMVTRYMTGAFVPSAGTGFALSRKTLQSFGDADVLPRDSLTEDYRLSLTLFQRGIRMYYVLEQIPRINEKNKLVWDYITTRSIFPNTFKTAVKQKTRWILGITMQSFRARDIFRMKKVSFAGRYSLYKDLKAKLGNLLVLVGYPVLIYFLLSLFIPLPVIYPQWTLSWYLSLAVTVMMIERQVFRSVAIYNVYGMRSVFFACLLPPILPLRLMWGNIINMVSTMRAYRQKWFGQPQPKTAAKNKTDKKAKKPLAWAKTDHAFLEKQVLERYRRKLGDILLERGYLTPAQLQKALYAASTKKETLGGYLRRKDLISEEQLLDALASVKHIKYVTPERLENYRLHQFAPTFEEGLLRHLMVLPLLRFESGVVFAFCDESPDNAQTILRTTYQIEVRAEFLPKAAIEQGLKLVYAPPASACALSSPVEKLYAEGRLNYEQVILVRNFCSLNTESEQAILTHMGLLPDTADAPSKEAPID
ncbi:MAG: hypothetical protein PWQ08_1232 [Clostridiales bacterium]|nr:hypothetical protein [Clostridiales bacterium]